MPGKFHGQRSLAGYSPWSGKRVRQDNNLKKKIKNENKVTKPLLNILVLLSVRVLQSNRIGEKDRDTKRDSF